MQIKRRKGSKWPGSGEWWNFVSFMKESQEQYALCLKKGGGKAKESRKEAGRKAVILFSDIFYSLYGCPPQLIPLSLLIPQIINENSFLPLFSSSVWIPFMDFSVFVFVYVFFLSRWFRQNESAKLLLQFSLISKGYFHLFIQFHLF